MPKTTTRSTEPTVTSITFSPDSPREVEKHVPEVDASQQSIEELRKRTQELSARRIAAQQAMEKNLEEQRRFSGVLGGLRQFFDRDGSARERITQEYESFKDQYDAADKAYTETASELIMSDANAREMLIEDEVLQMSKAHEKTGGQEQNPIVKAWKTLNTWNSEWSAQKILGEKLHLTLPKDMDPRLAGTLRFVGKMMTPRTAIALGLVGVGFGAFGVAAKALDVGLGAVAGLAAMRGLGVGVASRDVLQWAREELPLMKLQPSYDKDKPLLQRFKLFEQLTPESIEQLPPEEIKKRFVDASSAVTLYGKTELLQDPRYQALLKAYSVQTSEGVCQFEEAETGGEAEQKAEQCMKFLDSTIKELGSDIAKAQKEKKIKGVTTVALLTTAAVVLPGIAHLRRLGDIHPQQMAQLAKEAGKTIQESFGSLIKFFDFSPPAGAAEAQAVVPAAPPAGEPAAEEGAAAAEPAAPPAAEPPAGAAADIPPMEEVTIESLKQMTIADQADTFFGAATADADQTSIEDVMKLFEKEGLHYEKEDDTMYLTSKVGEGLSKEDSAEDHILMQFLGKVMTGTVHDALAKDGLNVLSVDEKGALLNMMYNLRKDGFLSFDKATGTVTLEYDPRELAKDYAYSTEAHDWAVATADDYAAKISPDRWNRWFGFEAEEPKGAAETAPPTARGGAAAETPRARVGAGAAPVENAAAQAAAAKVGIPIVEGATLPEMQNITTASLRFSDQALAFSHEQGRPLIDPAAQEFLDKLATQGIINEQSINAQSSVKGIALSRPIPEGVSDTNAMLSLLSKLCIGEIEYLKQYEGISDLRPSDKGTIYQVFKDLVKEGALGVTNGRRAVLFYDPEHLNELFDKAYRAKHVTVDRVAGNIPAEEWNGWLSWEERPVPRAPVTALGSESISVPPAGAPATASVPLGEVATGSPAVESATGSTPVPTPSVAEVAPASASVAPAPVAETASGSAGAEAAKPAKLDLASMTIDQKHEAFEQIAKTLGKEGKINPDLLKLDLFREGGMTMKDLSETVDGHIKSVSTPNLAKLLQLDSKFSHGDVMALKEYLDSLKPSSAEQDMRIMDIILKKNL
ncbi:hypothetical protein HY623_04005 [Candidatus Uhrbacteria bacterium]|nr:hypothetical protein [Candidatus Uhrbacteria bacterium]